MESSVRKYEEPSLQVIGSLKNGTDRGQQYRRAEVRSCKSSRKQGERRQSQSAGRRQGGYSSLELPTPGRTAMTPAQRRRARRRRERRRRARIRRRIVFALCQVILIAGIGFLFYNIKSGFDKNNFFSSGQDSLSPASSSMQSSPSDATDGAQDGASVGGEDGGMPSFWQRITDGWSGNGDQTYADFCGLDEVEAPVKREPEEVLRRLEELGQENEQIAAIIQNYEEFPDKMLEALANNPEMTDFVAGYPTASQEASGGLTDMEKNQEHPLFLQWDPRWGYASYGDDSNIGLAGCGPVSLSMALYYLTGDDSMTPDVLADYAMKNGYYMAGTGTAWALMTDVPGRYGVSVTQPGIEEFCLKQELDAGHVIICAMRPGDFTALGHFIVIYGYDEEGFRINDPNCVARSRKSWPYDQIRWQIKQLWSLGKRGNSYGTQTGNDDALTGPGETVWVQDTRETGEGEEEDASFWEIVESKIWTDE